MKSVLVIDDDEHILKLLAERLREEGFSVLTAGGSNRALEVIGQEALFAILLDMNLAECDGLTLLETLKGLCPSVPIIMVTGECDENKARLATNKGALDYITKPVNFEYLKNLLILQMSAGEKLSDG